MVNILVDTSVLIDYIRRKDRARSLFARTFENCDKKPCISLITVSELWAGKSIENKGDRTFIERLVNSCELLPADIGIAKATGKILRQTSYEVPFQDAFIAATAKTNNLKLLTLNTKDFKQVPGIKLLKNN